MNVYQFIYEVFLDKGRKGDCCDCHQTDNCPIAIALREVPYALAVLAGAGSLTVVQDPALKKLYRYRRDAPALAARRGFTLEPNPFEKFIGLYDFLFTEGTLVSFTKLAMIFLYAYREHINETNIHPTVSYGDFSSRPGKGVST